MSFVVSLLDSHNKGLERQQWVRRALDGGFRPVAQDNCPRGVAPACMGNLRARQNIHRALPYGKREKEKTAMSPHGRTQIP